MRHLIPRDVKRATFQLLLVSLLYPLVIGVVLFFEYTSELSKIGRGFFTDTFSPYFYTHILTFPTSEIHPAWGGYPVVDAQGNFPEIFPAQQYRDAVQQAMPKEITNILLQYALIVALLLIVVNVRHKDDFDTK